MYAEDTIKAARADGPITQQLRELMTVIDRLDGSFGDLRGRLAPILDQRDRPESVPGVGADVRSPSCELGNELEHAVGRLRRLAHAMTETADRVEL